MAHAAQLDENNKVMQVIVIDNEYEGRIEEFAAELFGGVWKQTSYNARIRGKYAAIGDTYNEAEDIFITPQPHPSWTRMGSYWNAPVPYPADGKFYQWNEEQLRWDAV